MCSSNSTSQFFCVTLKFDINFADLLSKRRKQKCQRNQPTNSSQLNYISFDFWKFKQLQTSFLLIEFRNWQLSRLGMWATVTWKRKWITSTHWVVESRYLATILFIFGVKFSTLHLVDIPRFIKHFIKVQWIIVYLDVDFMWNVQLWH